MKCGECGADIEGLYHNVVHELWETRIRQQKERAHEKMAEEAYITVELNHKGIKFKGVLYPIEEV
jgi:hypothetical protein